jgi:ubiquinone/menaquinone biosynthesis C-methylase UbiE
MVSMRMRLAPILIVFSFACGNNGARPATTPASAPATEARVTPAQAPPASQGDLAPSANPGINDRYKTADGRAASVKVFEGSERGAFQKPDDILKLLNLKQGDVVGDVGAGSGYMTLALSKAVGAAGKVYAEDITPGFLDEVRAKIAKDQLKNVEVLLGTTTDVKLPDACCDVIFVLDAYHHFEWPEPMLASIRKALKPKGRLVIIEFHRKSNPMFEKLKIDYEKHIQLDDNQVVAQVEKLGWTRLEKRDFPPYQYVAVFAPAK